MYCPRCGANQGDELRFCNLCGANLYAVRNVVDTRETEGRFDWSKTWVAEMFLSGEEAQRRQVEMERRQGITPEVKRLREIKGGVITGSVGLGIAIFLYVFMEGLIQSGKIAPAAAEIISRLWIIGVIPFLIGVALIINGIFVSKRIATIATELELSLPDRDPKQTALRAADTSEFLPSNFSVTEGTTQHLSSSQQKQ
jgi:hypothetical protein